MRMLAPLAIAALVVASLGAAATTPAAATDAAAAQSVPAVAPPPHAGGVQRFAGADRYAVAVSISQYSYVANDPNADTVYVVNGGDFPDALGASAAAGRQGVPLLLTTPGALPGSTRAELQRLQPSRIVIVGGPASVSPAVQTELGSIAARVDRIAGANRYEVSSNLAASAFPSSRVAFIATGASYADALSAAAVGGSSALGANGAPVLLVNPGDTTTIVATLRARGITSVYVVGGTASVAQSTQDAIANAGIQVVARIGGSDRYAVSAALAARFLPDAQYAFLATGGGFADALSAGALAADLESPLLLVQPTCIPGVVDDRLAAMGADYWKIAGGPASVSDRVAAGARC